MGILVQEKGVVTAMTREELDAKFGAIPTPEETALPHAGRVYGASTMFRKMIDAEYEAHLQIRTDFPPRL
jgi:hypothetical protein